MSFYPGRWTTPVSNSSAEFDYDEWCRVGRTQASSQVARDTRNHPVPQEDLSREPEFRTAMGPGSMLLFSSGHLHATAPNSSDRTRFSIDFRTVHREDLSSNRGAPNADSAATGTTIGDFLDCLAFAPIPQEIATLGAQTR